MKTARVSRIDNYLKYREGYDVPSQDLCSISISFFYSHYIRRDLTPNFLVDKMASIREFIPTAKLILPRTVLGGA